MSASADPEALRWFVRVAGTGRRFLEGELRQIRALSDEVVARSGHRAVRGEALDGLDRLLSSMEDNEEEVAGTRHRLLCADLVPWTEARVPEAAAGEGGGSPWFDPFTDSWVVNLARLGAGVPPSPSSIERVITGAPEVVATLGEAASVFSTQRQAQLLLTDPARFADNWRAFGAGTIEALGGAVPVGIVGGSLVSLRPDQALAYVRSRLDAGLWDQVVRSGELLVVDPDEFGESAIGWDQLQADPYRWLGAQVPDALAEVLSAGSAGAVALGLRSARLRRPARLGDDVGQHLPDLDTYRRGEDVWAEPGPVVSHRDGPFESPEGWVGDINGPGRHASAERGFNCIDCARAVEANWRGYDAVAAPVATGRGRGVGAELLEDWSGGFLEPTTVEEIGQRLDDLGPGSSAMVVSRWEASHAHAYNAVNDGGAVTWVDGQTGQVGPWPPPYAGEIDATLAIFRDASEGLE